MSNHKPDFEKISKMHPLEKTLIALRGAFQYAEKHGIHVDNRHSINLINKTITDYIQEQNGKESSK